MKQQKSFLNLALLVALVPLIVKVLQSVAGWVAEYKAIKTSVTAPAVTTITEPENLN